MTRPRFHIGDQPSRHVLAPWIAGESMTVAAAAKLINQSKPNVRRLAARFDLGRRLNGPWMISRVAFLMYIEANAGALRLYHAGDRESPEVLTYFRRLGISVPTSSTFRAAG